MNLNFFKAKVEERYGSVEKFSEELGVSKIAVYKWLKADKLPEDRISKILDILNLNEDELGELFAIPKVDILLRKVGNTPSGDDIKGKFKALANTFFKLDTNNYHVDESLLSVDSNQSPIAIANYLRTLLCLEKDEPATMNKTMAELKKHNINLFFFPLQKSGYPCQSARSEVAFTARKGNKFIVFVDTRRTFHQINFDTCHELTHIVCRHQAREHNAVEEDLCNKVAQELVYPRHFISNNPLIEPFLNAKKYSWHQTLECFQSFLSDFEWSAMGLGLALVEYGFIKKGSHEDLRLKKLYTAIKEPKVDDLFFERFIPSEINEFTKFFETDVLKDRDIYKPLIELKNAATFDRLSSRRFAEIFNVDSGDADELVNSWRLDEEDSENIAANTNSHE